MCNILNWAGVKNVKKDDLVVLHWRRGAGIESQPPSYLWQEENLMLVGLRLSIPMQ